MRASRGAGLAPVYVRLRRRRYPRFGLVSKPWHSDLERLVLPVTVMSSFSSFAHAPAPFPRPISMFSVNSIGLSPPNGRLKANEAEERWQKAAAALGPAERQVKFLRLLGAKGAASAAATGSGSAGPGARNAEARASSEMSSTVADGTTGAHKVSMSIFSKECWRREVDVLRALGGSAARLLEPIRSVCG